MSEPPVNAPLAELRVLEVSTTLAAASCTKLLADLGADVVRLEPASGDPWRHVGPRADLGTTSLGATYLYANTGKRAFALAERELADGRVDLLMAAADLLVTDLRPGDLDPHGLLDQARARANPSLVVLCLSRFGGDGPRSGMAAEPLNTYHAAGEGTMTPLVSVYLTDTMSRPPVRQGRFVGEHKAATYAACLALAAVRHASLTGVGQVVDVSVHEALAGLNFFEFSDHFAGGGPVPSRQTRQQPFGGLMRCADGYVQLTIHEDHHWNRLVAMMGEPAWTKEPWAADHQGRAAAGSRIHRLVGEWLERHDRSEIVERAMQFGCTAAPYLSVAEATGTEQIRARRFLQAVDLPGVGTIEHPTQAYRFDGEPVHVRAAPVAAAPLADAAFRPRRRRATSRHTPTTRSLDGIRVADFTWALAGPTATMILAALGADVIKVESSARPDVLRRNPGLAASTGRQKRSLSLDLSQPRGREVARRLIARSDVVAENFRPGVMARLGLGVEQLRAEHPDLIVLSISMSGQTGPNAEQPGYAPMFAALAGLGDLTGYTDGPPSQIRTSADVNAGIAAALAVLASLERRRTGNGGCHIDLSAVEAQMALIGETILEHALLGTQPTRAGNAEPDWVPHDCYPCEGHDRWLSVAVRSDEEWRRLADAIGLDPARRRRWATADQRLTARRQVDDAIGAWTATHTAAEAERVLQAAGVAAVAVLDAADLAADPHMIHRGFLVEVPGAERTWPLVGLGGVLPATPLRAEWAGPPLGAHNDEVLADVLGFNDSERAALAEEGVLT
ncbi:MAG TPA: CoA transferase [Ilumatobacter sp.]|nr:CoA transferase [Ilumatobacter sp.]